MFFVTALAQIYPELARLEGERALLSWLRRSRVPPMELRDEGLLRLSFADHLPPADALALVRRLRGEALRAAGPRFPVVVGRMGAEYHAWAARHLAELEAELSATAP